MNRYVNVVIIVEGKTEEIFIKKVLGEYLALKQIYVHPSQISKPGQKGGDVRQYEVTPSLQIVDSPCILGIRN